MLNAAQQQGFEALRQGMAPSANQQAALHSLWEKAPGYVPAHRGGWDEFPSAPAADAADGFRSGPSALGAAQDAGEAARRQAFLKWTQGEAMTAQEKAFVEDLWNTDPAKASEYWAAGEFLDTEVPASDIIQTPGAESRRVRSGEPTYGDLFSDAIEIFPDSITPQLLRTKPKYARQPKSWLEQGGKIHIDKNGNWIYTDASGIAVRYKDGYPDFKEAGLVWQEIIVQGFQGYSADFRRANQLAPYGMIDAKNHTWHHMQDGCTLQEVDKIIHRQFTHQGGMAKKRMGKYGV